MKLAAGGLVGQNGNTAFWQTYGTISDSYSTGAITAETGSLVGGLVGVDVSPSGNIVDTYWDTTTSGITNPAQGAGEPANDLGITGLTSSQLQSGLPTGLSASIWNESSSINSGFPYLLENPPPS